MKIEYNKNVKKWKEIEYKKTIQWNEKQYRFAFFRLEKYCYVFRKTISENVTYFF